MAIVAFDQFVFDPRTLELSGDGRRIDLAPKPALLLKALIAATPGIVTREEAQQVLWPDGPHADPEQGLNACVRQLRAALGDGATEPAFIETLPKRGYRLKVPVREAGRPASKATLTHPRLAAAAGLLVTLGIAAVIWQALPGNAIRSVDDLDAEAAEFVARAEALRARHEGDDLEVALELYERVLAEHPRAAPALAGKAIVLVRLSGRPAYPRKSTYDMAMEFADAADSVGLLPDAAVARAYMRLNAELDPAAALPHFDEAVARDPNHAESRVGMAAALSALGRTGEAIEAATAAAHIDPLSYSARSDRCWYLLFDHRRDEALAACNWATEIDGDHTFSYLGAALAAAGDQVRMRAAMERYFAARGLAYLAGDIENGGFTCRLADRMASLPQEAAISAYEIASFYALCGDARQAQRFLDRAVQRRQPAIMYFPYDPRFDAVRSSLTAIDFEPARRSSPM